MIYRRKTSIHTCPKCGFNLDKCSVPNCENEVRNGTLCNTHWARKQRYGNVQAGVPIRKYSANTAR